MVSVNVNGIYYVHVHEQARWACSVGSSTIENLYYYYFIKYTSLVDIQNAL